MLQTCLNCGNNFEGHYCSGCGQKATVKRITGRVLLEEIIHFFTHLEKGFLHTTWNFLVRPGLISINYLEGKRKRYQKPISYFLIWTGLYILAHNIIIDYFHYSLNDKDPLLPGLSEKANLLLRSHFTSFIIPLLLVSALLLYFVVAKPIYNFTEVLTLCLYGGGTYFMMLFVSDIVMGCIFRINILSINIFSWQTILSSLYNFWFAFDLFKRVRIRFFWLRLIATTFLVTIAGWFVLVYLPQAWFYITG